MTNINLIIGPYLYLFAISALLVIVQGYIEDIVLRGIMLILSCIFFFLGLSVVF